MIKTMEGQNTNLMYICVLHMFMCICRPMAPTVPLDSGEIPYSTIDEALCESNRQFLSNLDFVQVFELHLIHAVNAPLPLSPMIFHWVVACISRMNLYLST